MATSSARSALAPLLRRSVVSTRSTSNALRGGASPPLPPFARYPAPTEKLVEQHDAIWDDGVAPEATIDFDASHIPTREGLLWWLGGLTFFTSLYNIIGFTDPGSKNPAVNRKMNMVVASPKTGPPSTWNDDVSDTNASSAKKEDDGDDEEGGDDDEDEDGDDDEEDDDDDE